MLAVLIDSRCQQLAALTQPGSDAVNDCATCHRVRGYDFERCC